MESLPREEEPTVASSVESFKCYTCIFSPITYSSRSESSGRVLAVEEFIISATIVANYAYAGSDGPRPALQLLQRL
jgi:hypothetical protein